MHVSADKTGNNDSPRQINVLFFRIFREENLSLANISYLVSSHQDGSIKVDISVRIDCDDCSVKVQHFVSFGSFGSFVILLRDMGWVFNFETFEDIFQSGWTLTLYLL